MAVGCQSRDQRPLFDTTAPEPDPGFEFDQRVSW
jgi:hypothetical protein